MVFTNERQLTNKKSSKNKSPVWFDFHFIKIDHGSRYMRIKTANTYHCVHTFLSHFSFLLNELNPHITFVTFSCISIHSYGDFTISRKVFVWSWWPLRREGYLLCLLCSGLSVSSEGQLGPLVDLYGKQGVVRSSYYEALPLSHLSPCIPRSHPFGQVPVTWLHCTPPLQLPHLLQSEPYV